MWADDGPWQLSHATPNSVAFVSICCEKSGSAPHGVLSAVLPCVVWQDTQTAFQLPLSETSGMLGGCITADRRGIQRSSATRRIAGNWPSSRPWPVEYQ